MNQLDQTPEEYQKSIDDLTHNLHIKNMETPIFQSNNLLNEIKNIETELMFNKKTNFNISDLMAATNKFNDITKPKSKAHNFNKHQNLY